MISFSLVFSKNSMSVTLPSDVKSIDEYSIVYCNDALCITSFKNDNRRVNDSFFIEDEELAVINIGVLYSRERNTTFNGKEGLFNYIAKLYKLYGEKFPNEMRGAFCGAVIDKKNNKVVLYNDHTSNRRVFWSWQGEKLFASSDFLELNNMLISSSYQTKLFEPAAYMMLSYGYMLHDATLADKVYKLIPGSTLAISNLQSQPSINRYFDISELNTVVKSMDEYLSDMEETLSNAIVQEFERDNLSNAEHIITLSGGLDSRAVRIVAHDLGFDNMTDICMSQSGYLDQLIAQDISSDLIDEFIFFTLDNGMYLVNNIEQSVQNNGGTIIYAGNAHMDHMIDRLNFNRYGMLHTGIALGGVMGGAYIQHRSSQPYLESGTFSNKLVKEVEDYFNSIKNNYKNSEIFVYYNRGINGVYNGIYSSQRKIEAVSVANDPDVIRANMMIPEKYRKDSKIYIEWMKKYHPLMTKYKWEKTRCKPGSSRIKVKMNWFVNGVIRRINPQNQHSMNPYEYWYKTNNRFKEQLDKEVKISIEILSGHSTLVAKAKCLWDKGTVLEKMQFITLARSIALSGIK